MLFFKIYYNQYYLCNFKVNFNLIHYILFRTSWENKNIYKHRVTVVLKNWIRFTYWTELMLSCKHIPGEWLQEANAATKVLIKFEISLSAVLLTKSSSNKNAKAVVSSLTSSLIPDSKTCSVIKVAQLP